MHLILCLELLRPRVRLIVHVACLLSGSPVLVLAYDNECLLFAIIMTPVMLMRSFLVALINRPKEMSKTSPLSLASFLSPSFLPRVASVWCMSSGRRIKLLSISGASRFLTERNDSSGVRIVLSAAALVSLQAAVVWERLSLMRRNSMGGNGDSFRGTNEGACNGNTWVLVKLFT